MRFPMTLGRAAKAITALVALIVPFQLVVLVLVNRAVPLVPWWFGALLPLGVLGTLAVTVLWAPRAVRLEPDALVVERLAWFDFRLPLRDIALVDTGPTLGVLGGGALRVAGNGGLMGFTGFFWVRDVGLVRLWATQLGAKTVLLRRHQGRAVVLGVDDAEGLERALKSRLPWA